MAPAGKRSSRSWTVELVPDETGAPVNRQEVQQSLLDIEAIGHRLGGVVNAAPLRQQIGEEFVTTGWLFEWAQYAPAVQASPTPEPEPEPVPEPVLPDEPPAVEVEAKLAPSGDVEFEQRLEAAQAS